MKKTNIFLEKVKKLFEKNIYAYEHKYYLAPIAFRKAGKDRKFIEQIKNITDINIIAKLSVEWVINRNLDNRKYRKNEDPIHKDNSKDGFPLGYNERNCEWNWYRKPSNHFCYNCTFSMKGHNGGTYKCPKCGEQMIVLNSILRVPRRTKKRQLKLFIKNIKEKLKN